jgi:hypothetical protein
VDVDDAMKSAPDRADYVDIRDFIRDWDNYWDQVKPSASALLARAGAIRQRCGGRDRHADRANPRQLPQPRS